MKKISCLLVILSLLTSGGCSEVRNDVEQDEESTKLSRGSIDQDPEEAKQSLEAAMAAQNRADSLEGGWTSTDKLISEAKAALARGDHEVALKLARQARVEAELAYNQAKHERDHWAPPPYAR